MKNISLSSCEAEYRATKEVVQLQHVLTELGPTPKSSTKLKYDNQGAIQLTYNLVYHSKENHFDLDAHYICELMENGILSLQYCPIEQEVVDIFTKSFTEVKFVHLCVGPSPSHY